MQLQEQEEEKRLREIDQKQPSNPAELLEVRIYQTFSSNYSRHSENQAMKLERENLKNQMSTKAKSLNTSILVRPPCKYFSSDPL